MISEQDVAFYNDNGYLVVPDVLSPDDVAELRQVTEKFVEDARNVSEHNAVYDLEDSHSPTEPRVRRIKTPHAHHEAYARMVAHPNLLAVLQKIWGPAIRFDVSKLNLKAAGYGAPVEWHQDWAFYPQTNDDMLAVGIMLEDCTLENGPLMVVPGSHMGKIYDHHQNGHFVGGINSENLGDIPDKAVPLTAPAGSISIHHVRMLHGSTTNQSDKNRPLLLYNYVAVDAFPIFHSYDWQEFNSRILRGEPTFAPRMEPVPFRIHAPTPPTEDGFSTGSLFDLQEQMEGALYAEDANAKT